MAVIVEAKIENVLTRVELKDTMLAHVKEHERIRDLLASGEYDSAEKGAEKAELQWAMADALVIATQYAQVIEALAASELADEAGV